MGYVNEAGQAVVTAAVSEAELQTSGEIVVVLADRSDGYSDIALAWAILASFTALAFLATFSDVFLAALAWAQGEWNHEWTTGELLGVATAVAILKFVGVWLLQLWQPLKFALIPGRVKSNRVLARAIALFEVGAAERTHGSTGVLLYVSMREHRAEIVADEAIHAKVPAEIWGEAMADMLAGIRDGRVAEGLAAGVRDVGVVLAEHFPRAENDVNELPDRLILI